jgi:cytochrome d ubiquinol oxidase subunit I
LIKISIIISSLQIYEQAGMNCALYLKAIKLVELRAMLDFDPFLLARLQFAANISFHILFPTISIGLCWVLVYFRARFTNTGDVDYEHAYYFWVKMFALTFAIGVVSGITMSFQFGTNWPGFMSKAGNIAGPLLGYEVLTAFFLEATFLGVMLFGKHRVSNRVHLLAGTLVAIGTSSSAFWILSLNSWMQTPAGYEVIEGIFYPANWLAIIFNPSFPYRLAHMLTACLLTAAFLLMGVSSWRRLGGIDQVASGKVFKTGLIMALVLAPLQIFIGDMHGLNTLKHQPAKIAAIEAIWETKEGAPFTLFAVPDEKSKTNRYALEIPKAASLVLTHKADGQIRGLNEFEGKHPPVAPLFYSFRIMVSIGMLMLFSAFWFGYTLFIRKENLSRWQLKLSSWMTFSGWGAVLSGWYVTEIGRQPWLVYGQLSVIDAVAEHSGGMVFSTLMLWLIIYVSVLYFYITTMRLMAKKPLTDLLQTIQHYPSIPGQESQLLSKPSSQKVKPGEHQL